MTMKDEIKACLIVNLETRLDPYLFGRGFKRSKSSLIYKRQIMGAAQSIDLALQIHPKDRSDAAAAIYPRMEVLVPAVDEVLDELVQGNLGLLEGVTGGKSKQPIGFTSEKEHPGRWFIFQPDSVPGIVEDLRTFLERWTIPLLDTYATAEDIVAADERNDGRIPRDRAQILRTVAAALVSDRPDRALAVMERWFASPGLRRRYQQVFDFIGPRRQ